MKKSVRAFLILACSFVLLAPACSRKQESAPADLGPAPTLSNFVLKNLVSEFPGEIKSADYAGQVRLVLFLRSDDNGCRGSIADWNGLQKDFADRGFTLIGAIVDNRLVDTVAAEVANLNPGFPVGLVTDARLVDAFGGPAAIRAIPTAFLLGRDNAIARAYPGYEPLARLRDDITRILDGQPLPPPTPPKP